MLGAFLSILIIVVLLYVCYTRLDKEKIAKAKQEKWYSGGALFLWAIFFWPGAIFYLISKGNEK